jgi:hypothetical protein
MKSPHPQISLTWGYSMSENRGMQFARGSMDIEAFTNAISGLLKKAWGDNWGEFIFDEPVGNEPERTIIPKITFDTYERVRSKTHKSLDPILFDQRRDPDNPDNFIKVYRMWFDVEVDFKIYHNTNREARILMDQFEEFLFLYKGHLKSLGISDIIFLAETKPEVVTKWNKSLCERNLRYLVRIERITTVRSNTFKEINTVVEDALPHNVDKESVTYGNGLITHYEQNNRYQGD